MAKYNIKCSTIFIIILVITLFSCENKQNIQSDIDMLKKERVELQMEIQKLSYSKNIKKSEITSLNEELKVLNIYKSGKKPKYILKIHLKQSHFSLDIGKHMKDAMNAIDFELPVDKDFYNSVKIGTEIVDEFRVGSFILYGDIGDWEMTVSDKEIRK